MQVVVTISDEVDYILIERIGSTYTFLETEYIMRLKHTRLINIFAPQFNS